MSNIDIGFLEECESWKLTSNMFVSKAGGKPAWLALENLPTAEDLKCSTCSKQLIFLCQVYAPFEESDDLFHRIVFVFVCKNPLCYHNKGATPIRVFRSQLPRMNQYYSSEPPEEDERDEFDLEKWVKLCGICGCAANKKCSKCKSASYCCREHQVYDWKESHRKICGTSSSADGSKLLFGEFKICIDEETIPEKTEDENAEIEKYSELEKEGKTGTLSEISEEDLSAHAAVEEDKTFSNFRKIVAYYPDQVLRYERNGTPLWIAATPKPETVPNCEYCGSERQFEFQIMPQIIALLKEPDLDWGVLIIYTCKNSCTGNQYKQEFVFKQDISDSKSAA